MAASSRSSRNRRRRPEFEDQIKSRELMMNALAPSIRRRPHQRPTLLAFDIVGKIHKPDIETMARQIDAAFDAYDRIDILLIMTDFEGLDADAAFDRVALAAQARSIRHVRKYGVVGAPAWAQAMINFADFLSPVDAKTFDLSEEGQAWAWIEADDRP